jgi:hypothetical protein
MRSLFSEDSVVIVNDAVNDNKRLVGLELEIICNTPTNPISIFKLRAVSMRIVSFIWLSTLLLNSNENILRYTIGTGVCVDPVNVVVEIVLVVGKVRMD